MCETQSDTQEKHNEAEELKVHVMETRKRVLGPEHPDTLTSIAHLAPTYFAQVNHDEASVMQMPPLMDLESPTNNKYHPITSTVMPEQTTWATYPDSASSSDNDPCEEWYDAEELTMTTSNIIMQGPMMGHVAKECIGPDRLLEVSFVCM